MSKTNQNKTNGSKSSVNKDEHKKTSLGNESKKKHANYEVTHYTDKNIELSEDVFGIYYDGYGIQKKIKRFTWKNHNKIQVQVITYGARITSIKMPNNKGLQEDIVLGFDDLAGYLFYDKQYFGATLGRVANKIENATFAIDEQQHWLTKNAEQHHENGGFRGFDKAVWSSYVDGKTVILSHVFGHKEEGYPGELMVRIYFKLSNKNEFSTSMEAFTSKPTIINLSNQIYFNLAGHNYGPSELYKHTVTINANCCPNIRDDGFPTGTITNVMHTIYDFQVPKVLGKIMGINPCDGIDKHLCVNRGVNQEECFVARVLHSPSGRMMEIYSNQYGVNFSTANDFIPAVVDIPVSLKSSIVSKELAVTDLEEMLDLVGKLHMKMAESLAADKETDYSELRDLIRKIQKNKRNIEDSLESPRVPSNTPINAQFAEEPEEIDTDELLDLMLNPLQLKYLEDMKEVTTAAESTTDYSEVAQIIQKIIDSSTVKDLLEFPTIPEEEIIPKTDSELRAEVIAEREEQKRIMEESEMKRKAMIKLENRIPSFYKDGRIHGKQGAIYTRHGAFTLQTENYPNAIYHKNFPNCVLRPGEVYKHTITYKFWIREGSPAKWNRRYLKETKAAEEQRQANAT